MDDYYRNDSTTWSEPATSAAPSPSISPRAPVREEDQLPSARETREGSQPDALVSYIRSIASVGILSREEQFALASEIEQQRDAFLAAAFEMPVVAQELVERWRARKSGGYVTATLSASHLDGSGRDLSEQIDRSMGAVERLLGRTPRGAGRERSAFEKRLARSLDQAGLAFELVVEAYRDATRIEGDAARRWLVRERERREIADEALSAYEDAKRRFVRHNLKLVVKFAKQYRGMGVPFLDLIQEGNLGLIRAVEKFDHHRGHKFSTYAAWWIHQAMIRAVQKHSRTVRAPSHVYDLQLRYKRAERKLRGRTTAEPTRAEIAEELGIDPAEMDRLVSTMTPIVSTQATLGGTDSLTIEDALADEHLPDPGDEIDRTVVENQMHALLVDLEPRERTVIECRFGLGREPVQTLQVIGKRLGLSRERVRQIEARALERLRVGGKANHLMSLLEGERHVA